MYNYNEKHARQITTATLKNAYNIRSRKAYTVLKCAIDEILWDISHGTDYTQQEVYSSIRSDVGFSALYFDGYAANVSATATEKVMALINK